MRYLLYVVSALIVSIMACGCAPKEVEKSAQNTQEKRLATVHGNTPKTPGSGNEDIGMVAVIKKKPLADYAAIPFGEAIDGYRYFKKKEWSESHNSKGTYYVDVTGWLDSTTLDSRSVKEGIAVRGVQIKFAIYENGAFGVAMVSKMEAKTDGKIYAYPLDDRKGILDKIYANKEISF